MKEFYFSHVYEVDNALSMTLAVEGDFNAALDEIVDIRIMLEKYERSPVNVRYGKADKIIFTNIDLPRWIDEEKLAEDLKGDPKFMDVVREDAK